MAGDRRGFKAFWQTQGIGPTGIPRVCKQGRSSRAATRTVWWRVIRNADGWDNVKNLRKNGIRLKGDERILGDTTFVIDMLARANKDLSKRARLRARGMDLDTVTSRVAQLLSLPVEAVRRRDKTPQSVTARRLNCRFAHNELGLSTVAITRRLNINQSVVSRTARQGRLIAEKGHYDWDDVKA
jgi:hypothetical protein